LIEDFCRSLDLPGVAVRCVAESSPLGTAGGFCHAVHADNSASWLVCNGDSLVCADLSSFLLLGATDPEEARLLALKVTDCSRYGNLAVNEHGHLTSFNEKVPGRGLINAGVYLLRSGLLARFSSQRPLSFENEVFPSLINQNTLIRVEEVAAPFIDIGTESSLRAAETFIIENQKHFL
jgi:NDP-sugar pyrophosphorylase family protein